MTSQTGIATGNESAAERGTVTLFTGILALALLLMTGLVVDGGRLVNRYVEAHDLAANAARAGAQAVDRDALYEGLDPQVAQGPATLAVMTYMAGQDGTVAQVTVHEDQVVVDVQMTQPLIMLGVLPGVNDSRTVTARASASVVRGVEGPS